MIRAAATVLTLSVCVFLGAKIVSSSALETTYELRRLVAGSAPGNAFLYKIRIDGSGQAKATWFAWQYHLPDPLKPFRFGEKSMKRIQLEVAKNQFASLPNVIGERRPKRELYCLSTESPERTKRVYMYLEPAKSVADLTGEEARFVKIWSSFWKEFPRKSPDLDSESIEGFQTFLRVPLEGPCILDQIK